MDEVVACRTGQSSTKGDSVHELSRDGEADNGGNYIKEPNSLTIRKDLII